MLRSRASALQRAMSACMKLPNRSGVIGIISIASPERRSRSAGEANALLISALSLLVISAGIFAEIRSEEHTSELQSLTNLVCRLLLEKTKPGDSRHRS